MLLDDGDDVSTAAAGTSSSLMPLLNQCSQILDEKRLDKSGSELNKRSSSNIKLETGEEDMEFQNSRINTTTFYDEEGETDYLKINNSLLNGIINPPSEPTSTQKNGNRRRNIQKGNHYSCLKCDSVVSGPCIIKHINYKYVFNNLKHNLRRCGISF